MASRITALRVSMFLAAGSLVFASLGGCPQAQVPNNAPTPPSDGNTDTNTPPTDGNTLPRPIPGVPTDTTTNTGGGAVPTTPIDPGTGGSTGGGQQPGTVTARAVSPVDIIRGRNNFQFNFTYEIRDFSGALNQAALVAVRDANADGAADGDPVVLRSLPVESGTKTVAINTDELAAALPLTNGFGRYLIGVRAVSVANVVSLAFANGPVIVDTIAPTATWVTPQVDRLVNRDQVATIRVTTTDNAPHTVRILLDLDDVSQSGGEVTLVPATNIPAGTTTSTFNIPLFSVPSGTYRYDLIVSDGIAPATEFYAPAVAPAVPIRLAVTNRLVGDFDLNTLANPPATGTSKGAVLQGFNFNDLAGSSITYVPDLTGDGRDELLVGARYGKAYLIQNNGVGFGEAYMIYGSGQRLSGTKRLNSVGRTIPGIIFPGIRTPRSASIAPSNTSTRWTKGMSDITVIPDMDGDNLPELVFSFPRVESITIGQGTPSIQHPELVPDLPGMGAAEYDAYYGLPPVWHPNESQFTRGGIVIVSSNNDILRNPALLNRKSDRVFDLHETGQLFNQMALPNYIPFIRQAVPRFPAVVCADCDLLPPQGWQDGDPNAMPPTPGNCGSDGCVSLLDPDPITGDQDGREKQIDRWDVYWDIVFNNQPPGGFLNGYTAVPVVPPLASDRGFPFPTGLVFPFNFYPNVWMPIACVVADGCEVTNNWYPYGPLPGSGLPPFPPGSTWSNGGNPFQSWPNCYPDNPADPAQPPAPPAPPCPPNVDEVANGTCPDPNLDVTAGGAMVWTGFYGPTVAPFVTTSAGEQFDAPTGARVLGQKVEDQFGTSVSSDGTWLYITAPERTANDAPYQTDIPSLPASRSHSGIVYQLRTNAPAANGVTRTQLWIEKGFVLVDNDGDPQTPPVQARIAWPNSDIQNVNRTDYTMPVPHQYIIETVGSIRGNAQPNITLEFGDTTGGGQDQCPPAQGNLGADDQNPNAEGTQGWAANVVNGFTPYPVGTSGYYMDRTPQIVGPHADARIAFVKALGDINDDGIRDFAVGSKDVKQTVIGAGNTVTFTGPVVGSIFIVYGRPTGVEGDYLLEELAHDIGDANRLNGVLLQGTNANETLARVFDDAGDFNNDGIDDIIVGNEGAGGNAGEVIVILGSPNLVSPIGGWTTAGAVTAGKAIRFFSTNAGDLVGANVSGAGDVDGDNIADIMIAAPGAEGGRGAVYLIYGSDAHTGSIDLALVGTVSLPGAKFVGRSVGDQLGAGMKTTPNTDPAGNGTTAFSRGLASLGDIDGDGRGDYALTSMLADPQGRTDGGEVYVLYGRGD